MLDELRDRIAAYLLEHQVGVLSTRGTLGEWAVPVRYRSHRLEVDCLLPRWADAAYHLEQDPRVLLIVPLPGPGVLRWLTLRGAAWPIASPDWAELLPEGTPELQPDKRFLAIRVVPERIDLVDESRGWGARETLDL